MQMATTGLSQQSASKPEPRLRKPIRQPKLSNGRPKRPLPKLLWRLKRRNKNQWLSSRAPNAPPDRFEALNEFAIFFVAAATKLACWATGATVPPLMNSRALAEIAGMSVFYEKI